MTFLFDQNRHFQVGVDSYSTDGKSGFLSKQGIADIKSMLAKEIFQQNLISIYQRQTQRWDKLTEDVGEAMRLLVLEMQDGTLDSRASVSS